MDALWGRGVECRQQSENVTLEGEVPHHEGASQTELAGRPEQPLNCVRRAHQEGVPARGPEAGPVPELNTHRGPASEEMGDEGGHRHRRTPSRDGLGASGLLLGPQWARPGKKVRSHHCLLINTLNCMP